MSRRLVLSLLANIVLGAMTAPYAFATTPTPTAIATPAPLCDFSLCPTDARTDCKQDLHPGRSALLLHDVIPDQGDRLGWKWLKGAATSQSDFGDPVHTTDYELCVYDGHGLLVARGCAPANQTCNGRPCWKETSTGFAFRKRDLSPLRSSLSIRLIAGADGKGRVLIKGKGPVFEMPQMPILMPVVTQLYNSNNVCWETVFDYPAQANQAGDFKDNNEP